MGTRMARGVTLAATALLSLLLFAMPAGAGWEWCEGDPVVAFVVCYSGPLERGEAVVRPLRAFGSPIADAVAPTTYTAVQALGGDRARVEFRTPQRAVAPGQSAVFYRNGEVLGGGRIVEALR